MDKETKSGILKLRELRDELCSKQSQWKNAFQIKDTIVNELKVLKNMAVDPQVDKTVLVEKIDSLLVMIDPDRQKDLENSNV